MMINLSLIAVLTISGVHSMKDGRPVNVGEFPYVVSIRFNMMPLCSGTIIDERHILTTGHTVEARPSSNLFVVTGMVMIRFPWLRLLSVSDCVLHPGYKQILFSLNQNDPYWENDIALLLLTEPLVWDSKIARVPLSTTEAVSHRCFECAMISWNYFEELNSNGLVLMWEAIHIVDNALCNQWGISVLTNQYCFADLFETSFISFEDIGSPIICGNSMAGFITREGKNGITASPSTFLSILNYAGFIDDVINGSQVEVQSEEYPYIASIWSDSRFLCTGTIINSYQVMTVERCLQARTGRYDPQSLKIAVGLTHVWNLDRSINYFYVYSIISPDEYPGRQEHDIVLLTMSQAFLWSPTVQSLRLAEVENFSTQQFCQVVFWKRGNEAMRMFPETRKLVKLHLVLIDLRTLNWPLGAYQFVAKSPISANFSMARIKAGSPIICGGHPLGLLVGFDFRIASFPYMIFHRIHPYVAMGFVVTLSLRLADVENFSTQQFCQLIFWKHGNGEMRKEARKLAKLHLVLIDSGTLGLQLGAYQFAAKSPTSTDGPMALTDLGSPIICGGHPLGFLIKANMSTEWLPHTVFLRIHPHVAIGFLKLS